MNIRIFTLTLATFALGTDAFIVAGILPKVARDLDITIELAAQVVTAFSVVYAVGAPILATLLAGFDRKRLLLAGLVVFVLANIGSAFAPTFEVLIATRIVAALAACVCSPAAIAAGSSLVALPLRGRAIAMVTGGLAIATVIGVPLGTAIGTLFGWRAAFGLVVALGGLAFVAIAAVLPVVPLPPAVSLGMRMRVWTRPDVLSALLVTVASMTGIFAVYTFLVPIVRDVTLLDEAGASAVFLVYGIGALIGTALGGVGTDRRGAEPMLFVSVAGMLVALPIFSVLTLLEPSVVTTVAAFVAVFVWGAIGWAYNPAQSHRLLGLDPRLGPIVLSANGSAIHLGVGLGATLGALVFSHVESPASLGLVGGAFQLVALVVLAVSVAIARSSLSPVRTLA